MWVVNPPGVCPTCGRCPTCGGARGQASITWQWVPTVTYTAPFTGTTSFGSTNGSTNGPAAS